MLLLQDPRSSATDAEAAVTADGKQSICASKLDTLYATRYKNSHAASLLIKSLLCKQHMEQEDQFFENMSDVSWLLKF